MSGIAKDNLILFQSLIQAALELNLQLLRCSYPSYLDCCPATPTGAGHGSTESSRKW